MDRKRFIIKGNKREGEIFFLKDTFLVENGQVKKIEEGKLTNSKIEVLRDQLKKDTGDETKIDLKKLEILKKNFGDFELAY